MRGSYSSFRGFQHFSYNIARLFFCIFLCTSTTQNVNRYDQHALILVVTW
nr:MAG TPA: hypothetical protein [Caudoviricetes sp.]